ncbi:ribonuclease HII [Paenibacillus athensensis]|uniref:Ribonuclease HII n=1 Tax=Paenibacillus athensensis TaxID=1967502 RepID=A0A4Y8PYA0_9BACL|nr:ribonuclease HII [Paenibacillus athensensis]MCD1257839.1 ribonuclease HII [Paenibacillus athensensis]
MLDEEKQLWERGLTHIAGIDEVGRGCLFGDVVAAAVVLPAGLVLPDVNDSKKLSEKKREQLYEQIMEEAVAVGLGIVSVAEIERLNIKQAARLAMKQAVEALEVPPDFLLVDAEKVDVNVPQLALVHGDARSQSIAAASIIAKVTRDRMCETWDREYPVYGLAVHKGYGTKRHREMLLRHGPTPLHRKLFIRNIMAEAEQQEQQEQQLQLDWGDTV